MTMSDSSAAKPLAPAASPTPRPPLSTAAGAVVVRVARPAEVDGGADVSAAAAVLDDASRWLISRGLPTWPVPFPVEALTAGAARGELYLAEPHSAERHSVEGLRSTGPDGQLDRAGAQAGAVVSAQSVATVTLELADPTRWGRQRGGDGTAGYVHGLAVRRDHAGRGVGRALLAWVEQRVAAADRRHVRLDVMASKTRLRGYYERAGYACAGETIINGGAVALYQKRVRP